MHRGNSVDGREAPSRFVIAPVLGNSAIWVQVLWQSTIIGPPILLNADSTTHIFGCSHLTGHFKKVNCLRRYFTQSGGGHFRVLKFHQQSV